MFHMYKGLFSPTPVLISAGSQFNAQVLKCPFEACDADSSLLMCDRSVLMSQSQERLTLQNSLGEFVKADFWPAGVTPNGRLSGQVHPVE